jgi:hypothetical protein
MNFNFKTSSQEKGERDMMGIPFMRVFVLILALLLGNAAVASANLLVSQTGQFVNFFGYNKDFWPEMTDIMNAEFGAGNITTTLEISDLSQVLSADALWLENRTGTAALSSQELSNLSDFVASGKRVVVFSENNTFNWLDAIVEEITGDDFSFADFNNFSSFSGVAATSSANDLTENVGSVQVAGSGVFVDTGEALFDPNVAALFGNMSNVLIILDNNIFSDTFIDDQDNRQFAENVVAWANAETNIAPIPISSPLFLLAAGIIGLTSVRRRK